MDLDYSETDLSEVLQIEQVFTNVPKGLVAKKEDWQKAFNTENINKVIEEVSREVLPTSQPLMTSKDIAERRSPNKQPRTHTTSFFTLPRNTYARL